MSDYTSLPRGQWLELADEFYAVLRQDLEALPSAEWRRSSRYLGWRKRDVLAHMASAIPVNFRQVLDRAVAGDPSAPDEFNTFARNGREVARRRSAPVESILQELWSGLEGILTIYRRLPDDRWLAPAWFFVGPVNIRTLFLAQLGDNVFHARDLLRGTRLWMGLDPAVTAPLVDWFLRELRPAQFRAEKARGLAATVVYRLSGVAPGEWTMRIADGACRVEHGAAANPDLVIEADGEELVAAAQGRAAPVIGRLARAVDWVGGQRRREDVAAALTGTASSLTALLGKRIRLRGDPRLARGVNSCFWHFWERTEQTEQNIRRGLAGYAA